MGEESPENPRCLSDWTDDAVCRADAEPGRGAVHRLPWRASSSYISRKVEHLVTRAVSSEAWPPQSTGKPRMLEERQSRSLAHAELSTNSAFPPPSSSLVGVIDFLIFFWGGVKLHFFLIIQFCFWRQALKKCIFRTRLSHCSDWISNVQFRLPQAELPLTIY